MGFHYLEDEYKKGSFNNGKEFITEVERLLNGRDYENGSVEAAQEQADALSEVLSRLILMLFEKEVLTKKQILAILDETTTDYEWPSDKTIGKNNI